MKPKSLFMPLLLWLVLPFVALAARNTSATELTKGANVVINSQETVFTVTSPGSATTTFKTRITILNENGLHRAKLFVPYDKLTKVNYVKGTSYFVGGGKIKALKNNDILDVSAISDFSLFEDSRVKIADLTHAMYPFVVEFEYQTTSSNTLFYHTWAPLDEDKLSVEKATFTVIMPEAMKLRYREANLSKKLHKR